MTVTPMSQSDATAAVTIAAPIEAHDRIAAMDVLRGVAMLGILPVNIITSFAVAHMSLFNPLLAGPLTGGDRWAYLIMHLGFELKMMSLFSLLFGAGVVVFTRPEAVAGTRPRSKAGVYYRRLGWLALFGLLHAYGIWYGDILFTYALCALPLYLMRNLRPAVLLAVGVPLVLFAVVVFAGIAGIMASVRHEPHAWAELNAGFNPSPEQILAEVTARGGGSYAALWRWNFPQTIAMHLAVFPLFALWRIFGLMIVGMALFKLGVLSAKSSTGVYIAMVVVGYAVGLPMQYAGYAYAERAGFDPVAVYGMWTNCTYIASLFIAAGHIGVVMLLVRSGAFGVLGRALGAVGRMALTCYLMQTALCIIIFTFLGYFARLSRGELWGVTVGIWLVQLVACTLWLGRFRFGPMEWLWRSLTYWSWQPMRR